MQAQRLPTQGLLPGQHGPPSETGTENLAHSVGVDVVVAELLQRPQQPTRPADCAHAGLALHLWQPGHWRACQRALLRSEECQPLGSLDKTVMFQEFHSSCNEKMAGF